MSLTGLPILVQYFGGADVLTVFLGMFIVFGIIGVVCLLLTRYPAEESKRRRERETYTYVPSRMVAGVTTRANEEEGPVPSFGFSRSSGLRTWTSADTPSSPVGGTCLACGARVIEETSPTCVKCGAERHRCPVCQRYVAGGQDLLACLHCRTLGHANEMLAWVEQHEKCPYCARHTNVDELKPLDDLPRIKRRKS